MSRPKPTTDTPVKHAWIDLVMSSAGPGSATTRYVLLAMSRWLGMEHTEVWVSQRTLAEQTGLTERTVQARIKDAIAAGWLERLVRGHSTGHRGEGLASTYVVKIPEGASGWEVHQPEGNSGMSGAAEGFPEADDARTGKRFRPYAFSVPIGESVHRAKQIPEGPQGGVKQIPECPQNDHSRARESEHACPADYYHALAEQKAGGSE